MKKNKLDLKKLSKQLDDALNSESSESLNNWIMEQRISDNIVSSIRKFSNCFGGKYKIKFLVLEIMTREQLIELCQDAVVHHTKWSDRDSYSAQKGIQSIYEGLTAGLDFRIVTKEISPDYHSDDRTLIIEFLQPIDFDKLKDAKHLEISSREDYFKDCDPEYEGEMFDGYGIDFHSSYTQTYMPTRQRLEECGTGNDWY